MKNIKFWGGLAGLIIVIILLFFYAILSIAVGECGDPCCDMPIPCWVYLFIEYLIVIIFCNI